VRQKSSSQQLIADGILDAFGRETGFGGAGEFFICR
jgi:hypothetical protein